MYDPVLLAYLEPGSGSIIVQTVLAMLFSMSFILRRWIGALCAPLIRPFRRRRVPEDASDGGNSEPTA